MNLTKLNEIANFENWWNETGSGILPEKNHDYEEHAMRVSEIAWTAASNKIELESAYESLRRIASSDWKTSGELRNIAKNALPNY
jgi:hypothetical protein